MMSEYVLRSPSYNVRPGLPDASTPPFSAALFARHERSA